MSERAFITVVTDVLGEKPWPKPLHVLRGIDLVLRQSYPPKEAARSVGTTEKLLVTALGSDSPLRAVLGLGWADVSEKEHVSAARQLGQMMLGQAAEAAFEQSFREQMPGYEFSLQDTREGRTDTDYRVLNGQGRKIYRINIKFSGTAFRNALREVGLAPEDCFALGTYKIHSGLRKQEEERLPYFFIVVGVPELRADIVGLRLPEEIVRSTALIRESAKTTGKKDFEDAVVRLAFQRKLPVTDDVLAQLRSARWYVLSARRAENLMREKLWERVFALRVKRFAQNYPNAELDMHFSLSKDLTPLETFLAVLRDEGQTKIATLLERGEF